MLALVVQVAPDDCTGCGVCVEVCPAHSKEEVKHKAINMTPVDQFLERELQPQRFVDAARSAGQQVTLRMQEGYDHSYYFVSTFVDDHLRWHKQGLSG